MEQRITEQMSNLYDFFRRLYDQDQDEIRELQVQMEQCDMELQQLRQMKLALQAESGTTPSKQTQEKEQQNMLSPSRLVSRAAQHSVACSPGPPPLLKPVDKPVVSILVPAVRSPSPPLFKYVLRWMKLPQHVGSMSHYSVAPSWHFFVCAYNLPCI